MRRRLRKFLGRIPVLNRIPPLYKYVKLKWYYPLVKGKEELFSDYYIINNWSSQESVSGPGSTLEYTKNIRQQIPTILSEYDIKTMLDAPCGDFNWMQHLKLDSLYYMGGDIVEPLIQDNRENYEDETTRFIHLDITEDPLPDADLWLCRDCLIHFSNKDISKTLQNLKQSKISLLLTTSYPQVEENRDIPTGSARPLNLERPPFNFPTPVEYIRDGRDQDEIKYLGLWKKHQLLGGDK